MVQIVFQTVDVSGEAILRMERFAPLHRGEMAVIVLPHGLQFGLHVVGLVR